MFRRSVRCPRFAVLLIALALTATTSALLSEEASASEEASPEALRWSEQARDVFVDGVPRADAQVFSLRVAAGESDGEGGEGHDLLAVVWPGSGQAWIVDRAAGRSTRVAAERLTVHEEDDGSRSAVVRGVESLFANGEELAGSESPGSASSGSEIGEIGEAVEAAGGWLLRSVDRDEATRSVLVLPHAEPVGPLEIDALWSDVPSWQRRAAAATPDESVVDALASLERPTRLAIYFGTWCGDSRRGVPPLLETVRRAQERGAPVEVELVALARGFDEPLEPIRRHALTNVPTVLVEQNGREVGRVVETPRGDSLAADVVAILAGEAPPAAETFRETDRLLARGVYRVSDAEGLQIGSESFALFETEEGDRRLHAISRHGLRTLEIWQRVADGLTTFVEVTERDGERSMRSRAWRRDGALVGWTRGDASGVLRQRLDLPEDTAFLLPSLAARGLVFSRPSSGRDRSVLHYGGAGSGVLDSVSIAPQGVGPIDHLGRKILSPQVSVTRGGGVETLWLHPDHGVPLRAVTLTGARAELVELVESPEVATR